MTNSFDASGAKKRSPSSPMGAGFKRSPLASFVFFGACACLVLTPIWFDWGARFTFRNTILSVLWVLVYATLPVLILWRIKRPETPPHTPTMVAGTALAVLFVSNSVTWLLTGVGTTGEWLEFVMRFVLAGILIGYDRHLFPAPFKLGVVILFCLVMLWGAIVRFLDISTLTAADWKAFPFLNVRTTLAGIEKLLIAAISIGFALKAALSGQRNSPSAAPQLETPDAPAAQPHSPSRFNTFLSSLSATTGAAAKLVAAQTERTTLTTLTLPAAFRALGKDCVQQKRHLHCVPELIEQLRSVMAYLKSISEASKSQPPVQSLTDKAKAAGKQATALARQKQLGMRREALLAAIGKAIHEIQGEAAGAAEVVAPVRRAIDRLAALDADIARLSEVGKGSLLTPKRLAIGGGIAAVLLVGVMVVMAGSWMFGGNGGTSPDYRVSSDELINEHVRSKTTAQGKYQGKTIQLTGKVFMVWDSSDNIVSSPYLHIAHSGSRPDGIACCFNSGKAVQPFSQGEQATITGKYGGTIHSGVSGSFIVILKDCTPGGSSEAGAKQSGSTKSGGGSGFAAKVLAMDDKTYIGGLRTANWRKGTINIELGVFDDRGRRSYGPLATGGRTYSMEHAEHSAGSMADAYQAMLMLAPAQCLYQDTQLYGDCYVFGALDLPPQMYKVVFGELEDLSDANRSGRKARWQLRCTDATLHFVGEVIPNRLVRIENVIVQ